MIIKQILLFGSVVSLWMVCGGCSSPSYLPSSDYDNISLKSATLSPYRDMYRINRATLGFSPLPERANVVVERQSREGPKEAGYDVMLHIYAVQGDFHVHDISFKKVGNTYKWIGEQETITGPKMYRSPDPDAGRVHEELVTTFPSHTMDGHSKPVSNISYDGDDPKWSRYQFLTLSQMHTLLKEWGKDHK